MGTNKLQVIPFRAWHVALFNLREWDRQLLAAAPDCAEFGAAYFERNGVGYTGIVGMKYVGAAGVTRVVPGTWEAWAYVTHDWEDHGYKLHRMAKRLIAMHFSQPDVRRIQCQVDSTYAPAVRWALKLGLKKESTMQKYGPEGQDYFMMARIK